MSSLKIIKLNSGEEFISRIIDETSSQYTVYKARVVHAVPMGDGITFRIVLLPLSPAIPDAKITVNKSSVAATIDDVEIPGEFSDEYLRQTSDIEIVTQSSIITN